MCPPHLFRPQYDKVWHTDWVIFTIIFSSGCSWSFLAHSQLKACWTSDNVVMWPKLDLWMISECFLSCIDLEWVLVAVGQREKNLKKDLCNCAPWHREIRGNVPICFLLTLHADIWEDLEREFQISNLRELAFSSGGRPEPVSRLLCALTGGRQCCSCVHTA